MHHEHPQVGGEGLEAGGAACTMHTQATRTRAHLKCPHALSGGGVIHGQDTVIVSSDDVGCMVGVPRQGAVGEAPVDTHARTHTHTHTHTHT